MFDWVLNMTLHPPSKEFFIYLGKDILQAKKLGELKNEFLPMFGEMLWNKLLLS